MNFRFSTTSAALALLFLTGSLHAQLADACPGLVAHQAALIGRVTDPGLGGMPAFGAVVTARWEVEGEPGQAEVMVPDDGVYLICGVPRDIEVTVQVSYSGREGTAAVITLAEDAVRQDLTVSLTGQEAVSAAPLFIGPGSGKLCPDLQAPQLIQCILLDDCRFDRLGRVRARKVGSGSDTRELVETFVRDARRLEVDAVRDVRVEWEQRGLEIVLVSIEGTGIEFTEPRCKSWVTNPSPV